MEHVVIGWAIISTDGDAVQQCVPYYDMGDWLRTEYYNRGVIK